MEEGVFFSCIEQGAWGRCVCGFIYPRCVLYGKLGFNITCFLMRYVPMLSLSNKPVKNAIGLRLVDMK